MTRVRKRSFIIMSILGPIFFGLMFVIPVWLATREGEERVVEVLDESGLFADKLPASGSLQFQFVQVGLDSAKGRLLQEDNLGLLYIPKIDIDNPEGIMLFGERSPGFEVQIDIERKLREALEEMKLSRSGIDPEVLRELEVNVSVNTVSLTAEGEKEDNAWIATGVGYLASLLIYLFIFLYGVQTLRGVIEEKTNRIVEVIVSSVRPFQLMIGKIVGIGAVGLVQFMLWMVLTAGIYIAVKAFFTIDELPAMAGQMEPTARQLQATEAAEIFSMIESVNFPLVIGAFIFYFVGAYLFYGALFAAVGSAVDNDTDAQQFQLPITIPLIFSIVILSVVLRDPHGSLAFWTSIIPLTSPVVMMMRIPFGPEPWELALSMFLLVLGFIFTIWLASRIYRIGILMHGAKVNYKILARWLFMKY